MKTDVRVEGRAPLLLARCHCNNNAETNRQVLRAARRLRKARDVTGMRARLRKRHGFTKSVPPPPSPRVLRSAGLRSRQAGRGGQRGLAILPITHWRCRAGPGPEELERLVPASRPQPEELLPPGSPAAVLPPPADARGAAGPWVKTLDPRSLCVRRRAAGEAGYLAWLCKQKARHENAPVAPGAGAL